LHREAGNPRVRGQRYPEDTNRFVSLRTSRAVDDRQHEVRGVLAIVEDVVDGGLVTRGLGGQRAVARGRVRAAAAA
jgi:hypothetical protein